MLVMWRFLVPLVALSKFTVGADKVCHKPMDAIIILDGSGSITQENWIQSLEFAGNLAANILSLNQANKVGVVEFSQVAREAIPITNDKLSLEKGIKKLINQFQNGITRTELALTEAEVMFKKESLNNNDRVLIIVTDGKITPKGQEPGINLIYQPIKDLRQMGVRIIAISVTDQADIEALNLMVLAPSDVLKLSGYADLLEKVSQITQVACPTQKPATPPTTPSTIPTPPPNTPPGTPPTLPPVTSPPPTTPTTPSPTPTPNSPAECMSPYHKIGCYHDNMINPRPLAELLFTDRDPSSAVTSGKTIDWGNWETYLVDLVCRCSKAAEEKGYSFFAIQYYGECWSGGNVGETYKRDGISSKCIDTKAQACSNDNLLQCAGQQQANYVYGLDNAPRAPTCSVQYDKLGCFKDNMAQPRPLNQLIFTDRDPASAVYSGIQLDWGNWDAYMPALVCRCAEKSADKGFQYFGIQFYGECWAGGETYGREGQTDTCISYNFQPCSSNPRENDSPCTGKQSTNYVYGIKASAPTCDVKYERIGCYNDLHVNPRPLPQLILTDRDDKSPVYSKKTIDFGNWDHYIRDLVCRCARVAQNKRLVVIGLQNYGECWSGPEGADTYAVNGQSSQCITNGYFPCSSNSTECVGKENTNSVYKIPFQ